MVSNAHVQFYYVMQNYFEKWLYQFILLPEGLTIVFTAHLQMLILSKFETFANSVDKIWYLTGF